MPYNDDEEPPPPKPGPARPIRAVRLTKSHNSDAPLASNYQKVLLELNGVSSAASRASLDLVAVIDISGSMEGDKLNNAKRALGFIIRKLTDRDRLSIVQFNHVATSLCELRRVTEAGRAELEAIVDRLQTHYGTTNIEAGLRIGLTVIEERKFTASRAANIMLLSDGGETDGNARSVEPGDLPVHTFGFGDGHDSALLGTVAKKSLGGVYNYVADTNDPAKLSKAFSRILAGLVTIIAQDLELTVTPFPAEATIKKVDAGTYPADPPGDGTSPVTAKFGTLSSEEARSVVVELALSDRTDFRPYRAIVAEVVYRFTTAQGQPVTSDPERITIKRSRKVSATADAPPPVEIEVIRQQHVDSIREAVKQADKDRMEEAWNILAEALKKLVEARKKLLDPILEELQNELMKLLGLFKTKEQYIKHGRPYAIASEASHGRRRSVEKGDEAPGPYDTQRVIEYGEQAQLPNETPLPSAADEQEESEPEAPRSPAAEWRTMSVALRLLTAVLSLLAFSIMASARTSGWAGDYYGRYEPYRYAVGVNVIICFYSVAQAFVETRRPVSPRLQTTSCYCITFFLDQVLAYLLMSASSAAASRHHLWVSRFGKDRFNDKIDVAVWFSFLAFLTLSGNALISMANLFTRM